MFSWLALNTLCALPLALLALVAPRMPRVSPAVGHVLALLGLVRRAVRSVFRPAGRAPSAPAIPPAGAPGSTSIVSSGPPSLGDELVGATTRLLGPNWSSWGAEVLLVLFLAVLLFVLGREGLRARA